MPKGHGSVETFFGDGAPGGHQFVCVWLILYVDGLVLRGTISESPQLICEHSPHPRLTCGPNRIGTPLKCLPFCQTQLLSSVGSGAPPKRPPCPDRPDVHPRLAAKLLQSGPTPCQSLQVLLDGNRASPKWPYTTPILAGTKASSKWPSALLVPQELLQGEYCP